MTARGSTTCPNPDATQIARALEILHAADDIVELRAIHKGSRKRIDAGYFEGTRRADLVREAVRLNRNGAAVYVTLNEINPQLLGRYANRIEESARATVSDNNVTRRRWLLVDVDPQRPADTSATDEQLALALLRAQAVREHLVSRGWPVPIIADSGNGRHLLYRIDLPNDAPSNELIKQCLVALAARFDDKLVKVDTSVFNAARIIKLHGTVANKGDHLPSAPWRLSQLTEVPEETNQPVPIELLQALAAEVTQPSPQKKLNGHTSNLRAWSESDVQAFMTRGGIEAVGPDAHEGALRWKLKACPFNSEHGFGEAAIFLRSDGRLGFECRHNSCQELHWGDLRTLVDGTTDQRRSNGAARSDGPRNGPRANEHTNGAVETGEAIIEWSEPTNVLAQLSAPPFQADDVPPVLGEFSAAYACATGFDPSLCIAAAVGVAAAALTDEFQIVADSESRWFQQSRLWVLAIARPGAGKTPAQKEMLAPLWKIQQDLREAHQRALAEAEKSDDPPPPCPRIVLSDTTVEALSEVLRDTPRGTLIATDEFESWLGTLDAYRRGAVSRDRGDWLRVFDGGPHAVERVQRGSVFVPNWGASILTATTPTTLSKLTKQLPEDGLLQRFLPIIAGSRTEPRPVAGLSEMRARYAETILRLFRAYPRAHGGCISLSFDARTRFQAWLREAQTTQEAMGSIDAALESHLAKYPTFTLRLALTFHAANIVNLEHETARDPAAWPVPLATLETAIKFLQRARLHAVALYLGQSAHSEVYTLAQDLARAILVHGQSTLARRDLIQRVRAFRKAEERDQNIAIRLLVDLGWLRYAEGGYSKPTPARYAINPKLAAKFAQITESERRRRAAARELITEAAIDRKPQGAT